MFFFTTILQMFEKQNFVLQYRVAFMIENEFKAT